MAQVRTRKVKTLRNRNGFIKFATRTTPETPSQNGEDGIIQKLFTLIPAPPSGRKRWAVDVGAWNGKHLSNTYALLTKPCGTWKGLLIEANSTRIAECETLYNTSENICVCKEVSCIANSESSLPKILEHNAPDIPIDIDFITIDVDGTDYWIFETLLQHSHFRPKVVCVEFNPTIPDSIIYIQPRDDNIRHGSSLAAITELANNNGYTLVETTLFNAFFVTNDIYDKFIKEQLPLYDTSIEALHDSTSMTTQMYQLYDGTLKISGCKKLLWHRVPIKESDIQVLPKNKRGSFPFAPPQSKN